MNRSDTESAIKTAYVAFQSWKERTAKVTLFFFFRKCDIKQIIKKSLISLKGLKDQMTKSITFIIWKRKIFEKLNCTQGDLNIF